MKIQKYKEIMDQPIVNQEFLIEHIIPKNTIGMISASPKSFKSLFLLFCAINISDKKRYEFLETMKINHGTVVYLDIENSKNLTRRRLEKYKTSDEIRDLDLYFINGDDNVIKIYSKDIELISQREQLTKHLKQIKPDLIIVDSLIRVHDADENSATEMNKVYLELKKFKNELNTTLILIHHNNKQNTSYRGSTDILASVDWSYEIKKIDENKYKLELLNTRDYTKIHGFEFNVHDTDNETRLNLSFIRYLEYSEIQKKKPSMVSENKKILENYLIENNQHVLLRKDVKNIIKNTNNNTITSVINALLEERKIELNRRGIYLVKINNKY